MGLLDDQMQQYMSQQRQQQFFNMLVQMGQGLLSANRQGQPPLRALASGMAQGGSARNQGTGGLLDWMKMNQYMQGQQDRQEKKERERRQYGARDMLSSGALASARHPAMRRYDESGAALSSGAEAPPGLSPGRSLLEREEKGLLGLGHPDIAGRARAAEIYPKPQQPPTGFKRIPAGLEPISGGPADVGYLGRKAAATRTPTERQSKIKELKARGLSQSQAEDIASGRVRVSTDPVTGAVRLVNVATGRMTQPRGQLNVPKKVQGKLASQNIEIDKLIGKLPELRAAVDAGVGAVPAATELAGRVFGQFPTGSMDVPLIGEVGLGEKAVNKEVVAARTALRTFREDIISAYRTGKMPLQQQNRILQFVDKLGVIESAPDARYAFEQLEKELRNIRSQNEIRLGGEVPAEAPSSGERPQIGSDADYNALPSGAEFIAPDGTIRRKP